MTPRFASSTRPLDYRAGIQPMSAADAWFWEERRRRKTNPQPKGLPVPNKPGSN